MCIKSEKGGRMPFVVLAIEIQGIMLRIIPISMKVLFALLAVCFVLATVLQILYKAKGEDVKHKYTISPDLPQFLQAKCNAYNISDVSKAFDGVGNPGRT